MNLSLEQRHIIRELVRDAKAPVREAPGKLAAGGPIPAGIEPQPVPDLVGQKVPQIRSHRFFVTARQIALVDPKEPRIAEVIDVAE